MPSENSISIVPTSGVAESEASGVVDAGMLITDAGAAAIRTGTNGAIALRLAERPASLRQRNSKLLAIPYLRATAETGNVRVASTACLRSSINSGDKVYH